MVQALVATALDLSPLFFRKLLQSNAATTVLDFQPSTSKGAHTQVIVDRLNQVGCGFAHSPATGCRKYLDKQHSVPLCSPQLAAQQDAHHGAGQSRACMHRSSWTARSKWIQHHCICTAWLVLVIVAHN